MRGRPRQIQDSQRVVINKSANKEGGLARGGTSQFLKAHLEGSKCFVVLSEGSYQPTP